VSPVAARARSGSSAELPACGFAFDDVVCTERDEHFCIPRADKAQGFFEEVLVHTKGDYARRRFVLDDWQRDDILRPLFGWVRWDPERGRYVRRYRIAWIRLARKNGKSELLAGIVLYLLVADDEEGAEIYGAAKDTKQAKKVWIVVERMIKLVPSLRKRLRINKNELKVYDEKTGSFYEIITADAAGELGHNPHGVVLDEVITQPDPGLWNSMRTAMGTRAQALMVAATTSGDDPDSFAAVEDAEMLRVQEDPARAPHVFVYVRETPRRADPWDERNWHHANPALGSFLSIQALRDEALEARNDPTKENSFRQFRLNQWVQQVTRWMPLHWWDEAAPKGQLVVPEKLRGRRCFGGLDLSAVSDLSALVWFFPFDPPPHQVLWRFWSTEAMVPFFDQHTGDQFSVWKREGFVKVTEGDVIDYDVIRAQITQDAKDFNVGVLGLDKWNSSETTTWLAKQNIPHDIVSQGVAGMNEALKNLMRLVKAHELNHGGDPVARWNVDSVEVKRDDNENIRPVKPDRGKSGKRIDGVAALGMAIDGWLRAPAEDGFLGFARQQIAASQQDAG
jgi:phage terminase large subunit-like protein